jgi:hypothetical protein
VEGWSQLKPSDDVLEYYVTFPHPKEGIAKGPLMPKL